MESPKKTNDATLKKIASKMATRERRRKENLEFSELAKLLPLPETVAKNLDKASILKLTISCIKLKEALFEDFRFGMFFREDEKLLFNFVQSLEGFLMVLDHEGKISYVSEATNEYLGLSPLELIGSDIRNYVHMADHQELISMLSQYLYARRHYNKEKSFVLRLKCALGKRSAGLTQGLFKVVHFTGHLKMCISGTPILLVLGRSLPPSPTTKVALNARTFMFGSALDLKLFCLDGEFACIGFKTKELFQKSLYDFIHVLDVNSLRYAHRQVLMKGQSTSKYYRFLCKFGGYIWIQSEMSVVYKPQGKPRYIVAINHIISDIEEKSSVLSHNQKFDVKNDPMLQTAIIIEENEINSFSTSREIQTQFIYQLPDLKSGFDLEWNHEHFLENSPSFQH